MLGLYCENEKENRKEHGNYRDYRDYIICRGCYIRIIGYIFGLCKNTVKSENYCYGVT